MGQRARITAIRVQPEFVIEDEDGNIVDTATAEPTRVSAKQLRDGWRFDVDEHERQATGQLNHDGGD